MKNIRIGSRESRLAVVQSEMVIDYIKENCPEYTPELVTMKTTGDRILDRNLDQIGGKGLFVKELDAALMDGRSDMSVHSLKDMPAQIPEEQKFRVYASALTTILLDTHNYIPTTDNRLLRRIIRDYKYRGCSAQDTIRRWPSVRAGENKWIFPYQENADVMFNSAMIYELAVIKTQAEPVLDQVPENCEEYAEAYRLRKFLGYFSALSYDTLPPTSLLREFLGGSSFIY